MNILRETLEKMPSEFNSNQFCNEAKINGYDQFNINQGYIAEFLHQNCKQGVTKRRWKKKITNNLNFDKQEIFCINFLKEKGYKIYKQTINWEEIK